MRTVPLAQVPPPVMENVPLAPADIAGAAVNVNAPAVAPVAVLVTVIAAVLVVVSAGVLVSATVEGAIAAGAENVSVAPVIVNVSGAAVVFPPGVVTVMLLVPGPTAEVKLKLTERVSGPVHVVVTVPRPVKPATVVPVWVKFVPVRVTVTGVAAVPVARRVTDAGLRVVNVGGAGTVTLNGTVFVVPIGVTTAMFLAAVVLAVAEMLTRAVTVVPHVFAGALIDGHGSAT